MIELFLFFGILLYLLQFHFVAQIFLQLTLLCVLSVHRGTCLLNSSILRLCDKSFRLDAILKIIFLNSIALITLIARLVEENKGLGIDDTRLLLVH